MKKNKKLTIIISAILTIIILTGTLAYLYYRDSLDYKKNLVPLKKAENSVPASTFSTLAASDKDTTGSSSEVTPSDQVVFDSPDYVNILFLGIDRTEDRDESIGIYRSDTIALARFNLVTKKVKVLSIPRDTYTFVPIENKNDKINHAWAYGSLKKKAPESSIDAVNNFVKYIKVDYYFSLEMEPIPAIVDSIGGVYIDVDVNMKDHGANLSKGYQLLNGQMAYDYVHWRYSGEGDIDRIKRQQKFALEVFKKLKNEGKFLDALDIIMKYKKNIQTDLSSKQLIGLAKLGSEVPSGGIAYYNIEGTARIIDKIWYWDPDLTKKEKTLKEFLSDN